MSDKVTISADTFTKLDDARMRLQRIERDMMILENDIREHCQGSNDGYSLLCKLIEVADRIRAIMA